MSRVHPVSKYSQRTLSLGGEEAFQKALAAVHSNGLLHGDLKLSNLMMGDSPLVDDQAPCVIIDFGCGHSAGIGQRAARTQAKERNVLQALLQERAKGIRIMQQT